MRGQGTASHEATNESLTCCLGIGTPLEIGVLLWDEVPIVGWGFCHGVGIPSEVGVLLWDGDPLRDWGVAVAWGLPWRWDSPCRLGCCQGIKTPLTGCGSAVGWFRFAGWGTSMHGNPSRGWGAVRQGTP